MNPLKICTQLNLHKYPKDDISEYFRQGIIFHKKAGYDALDFPMKEIAFLLSDKSDIRLKQCIEDVKSDAEIHDIHFEVCHLPFTIWDRISHDDNLVKDFEKMLIASVDVAAMLGVDYAVLHPNSVTIDIKDLCGEKEYEMCMKHLSPIADYAKKRGVKLALENLAPSYVGENLYRYSQCAEEVCKMVDALDIGVCWDFGHGNIAGANQAEELAKIGSRLCVLHVNDNGGYGDDHLPPFMGNINWHSAIKALSDIKFNGLLNYEVATALLPSGMRESLAKYLIDAANILNSYFE